MCDSYAHSLYLLLIQSPALICYRLNCLIPMTAVMRFSELYLLCAALSLSWQLVYFFDSA